MAVASPDEVAAGASRPSQRHPQHPHGGEAKGDDHHAEGLHDAVLVAQEQGTVAVMPRRARRRSPTAPGARRPAPPAAPNARRRAGRSPPPATPPTAPERHASQERKASFGPSIGCQLRPPSPLSTRPRSVMATRRSASAGSTAKSPTTPERVSHCLPSGLTMNRPPPRVVAVHVAVGGDEGVEVRLAEQRHRLPRPSAVGALDEAEQRRPPGFAQPLVVGIGMAAGEEVVGATTVKPMVSCTSFPTRSALPSAGTRKRPK